MFNFLVQYGNGEQTSWIQNVKDTARLLLTVSIWRNLDMQHLLTAEPSGLIIYSYSSIIGAWGGVVFKALRY